MNLHVFIQSERNLLSTEEVMNLRSQVATTLLNVDRLKSQNTEYETKVERIRDYLNEINWEYAPEDLKLLRDELVDVFDITLSRTVTFTFDVRFTGTMTIANDMEPEEAAGNVEFDATSYGYSSAVSDLAIHDTYVMNAEFEDE